MRGFRLVALNDKGREAVEKQNIPDSRMNVGVEGQNPYTLSFTYKLGLFKNDVQRRRFYDRITVIQGLVFAKIKRAMKKQYGCVLGEDYIIEVVE